MHGADLPELPCVAGLKVGGGRAANAGDAALASGQDRWRYGAAVRSTTRGMAAAGVLDVRRPTLPPAAVLLLRAATGLPAGGCRVSALPLSQVLSGTAFGRVAFALVVGG